MALYVRAPLSTRNVEDLLNERKFEVSHEAVRFWWNRFGPMCAAEIARYASRKRGGHFFRADAAFASPAICQRLEAAGDFYDIRLPSNAVLREKIAHRLTRRVGRPSPTKVKRLFEDFDHQAASWDKPRRVIAKIEWHPGELFP